MKYKLMELYWTVNNKILQPNFKEISLINIEEMIFDNIEAIEIFLKQENTKELFKDKELIFLPYIKL